MSPVKPGDTRGFDRRRPIMRAGQRQTSIWARAGITAWCWLPEIRDASVNDI